MTAILLAFALVAYAPGPANLAVSLVAAGQGTGAALRMALGLALGLAVWGVAAALGLGALLVASETATAALRLVGGAYLVWLAVAGLRGLQRAPGAAPPAVRRPFRQGLLLNLSNPKAVLAWLAALAMGLGPASGTGALVAATAACAAIGLSNYLFWALLMSRGPVRAAYARAARAVDAAVAALFGLAGAALIREGLAR